MDESARIQACFRSFVEGSLITHNFEDVLNLFTEDAMGIGMGAQGVVRCREDLRPILMNMRSDVDDSQTAIQYSNMQIRYYGGDYASICATVTIMTTVRGQRHESHIGQCASLRRIEGEWKLYMVQATPLSIEIQEIDAYPLSFAEDEIETYRMQEQFSNIMRRNIIATYKIDFDRDAFEDYTPTGKYSLPVEPSDPYEIKIFDCANSMLEGETRLKFVETFSIANLKKKYLSGKTDVSLDYESIQPDGHRVWLRTNIHLFTDIKGHLKGYLYLFDIDKQKREELYLAQQAETDLSTGLYNKETTRAKIEIALKLYNKPATCAFFMIDLDCFKEINDTYGHAFGDFVIQRTAQILKASFQKENIIGRLGGDEFGVFYVGKNSRDALIRKAELVCQAIREIRLETASEPGTSVSIGIAQRTDGDCFDDLYRKADAALYITKKQKNRNNFTIYEENLQETDHSH